MFYGLVRLLPPQPCLRPIWFEAAAPSVTFLEKRKLSRKYALRALVPAVERTMTMRIPVLYSLSLCALLSSCIDDPAQSAASGGVTTTSSGTANASGPVGNPSAAPGSSAPGGPQDSSDSSSSAPGSSGGGGAPDEPDPALLTCNPGRVDECLPGQKCSSYRSSPDKNLNDATRCAPVIGNQQLGEACVRDRESGNDDCGPMLFCDAGCSACEGPGTCIAFCDSTQDPVQDCEARGVQGGHCFKLNDGAMPICKESCDPIAQNCKDPEQACHATLDSFLCTKFRPEEGSDGSYGQACDRVQSCAPGLTCRDAAEVGACKDKGEGRCCTEMCDLNAVPSQCTRAGESCKAIFDNPISGLEHVGVCTVN